MGYLPYQLVISSTNSRYETWVRIESMYFLFENWGSKVFPTIGVPENGWFISWKNFVKMDDFGVVKTPIFGSTPIC